MSQSSTCKLSETHLGGLHKWKTRGPDDFQQVSVATRSFHDGNVIQVTYTFARRNR